MLYAHFPDASSFKKIIEAIQHYKTLVFHFTQQGLCFQGQDNSKVSLLNVELKAQMFDGYLCDKDISAGIDVPEFYQIIKFAYRQGGVTISDNDDENQFKVEFTSEAGAQRSVDVQHVDTELITEKLLEIPSFTFDCIATIPSGEFLQIVQEVSMYFDVISISNGDMDGIEIVGKNSPSTIKTVVTKIATTHTDDDKKRITVINYNRFKEFYNLRLVKSITKAANLSPVVTLKFCSNGALVVEFRIYEMGTMQFFLAPKYQEDEKIEKDAIIVK